MKFKKMKNKFCNHTKISIFLILFNLLLSYNVYAQGAPNVGYPAGTYIGKLDSGQRYITFDKGWLLIPGSPVTVWDISNPSVPKRATTKSNAWINGHFYYKIGDMFWHEYLIPEIDGAGSTFMDLSKLPNILAYTGAEPAPGFKINQINGGRPEFYPYQDKLGSFNYVGAGGTTSGDGLSSGDIVIGNLLISFPYGSGTKVASFDISDPDRIKLLDVISGAAMGSYPSPKHIFRHHLIIVGSGQESFGGDYIVNGEKYNLIAVDFEDPTHLKISYKFKDWPGRYFFAQDEFGFNGSWKGLYKYNMDTNQLQKFDSKGIFLPDFYWLPVGNLIIGSGAENSAGESFMFSHKDGIDKTPPKVGFHIPKDGAVNQAITSRIGVVIHERLDIGTVNNDNFIVKPVGGGAPIKGLISNTDYDVINYAPLEKLKANTTYEVTLKEGGIKDVSGNAMSQYSFRFSTGSTVDTSGAGVPNPPATVATPIPANTPGSGQNVSSKQELLKQIMKLILAILDKRKNNPSRSSKEIRYLHNRIETLLKNEEIPLNQKELFKKINNQFKNSERENKHSKLTLKHNYILLQKILKNH